jgi:hypothetical protein
MKRDPRMVERKKTGLAKARKRVRQLLSMHTSRSSLRYFSTPGLSGDPRFFVTLTILYSSFKYQCLLCRVRQMVDSCVKVLLITKKKMIMYETRHVRA